MKWILVAGGVLVALVLVVVVIGTMLPRDHIATVTARIAGSPDAIWQAIANVSEHPRWRSDVQRVELLPPTDGKATWREHSSNGAILMIADRADPPNRFVTRIADDKLPFGGTWEYTIAPNASGESIVTITERGSVYNPVFRFVSRFILGHTATMDAYLRALGRKFGDDVRPTVIAASPFTFE